MLAVILLSLILPKASYTWWKPTVINSFLMDSCPSSSLVRIWASIALERNSDWHKTASQCSLSFQRDWLTSPLLLTASPAGEPQATKHWLKCASAKERGRIFLKKTQLCNLRLGQVSLVMSTCWTEEGKGYVNGYVRTEAYTHCRGERLSAALALARNLFSISFGVLEGNNLPTRVQMKKY